MLINKLSFNSVGSISVLQFKTANTSKLEIKTFNELLHRKEIEISEVSTSGSVNTIIVNNMSMYFLFMMDGDILMGAKQNRILNTSVLISPKSKIDIPVSCVERGRWSNSSRVFHRSDFTVSPNFRASKSSSINENLKRNKNYEVNQTYIWDTVENEMHFHKIHSPTSDYNSVYKNIRNELKDKFKPVNEANGAALFYGNKFLNADIFGTEQLYLHYFDRILNAASVYLHNTVKYAPLSEQYAINMLYKIMYYAEDSIVCKDKAAGEGTEKRFENDYTSGFELTYNESLIHYTLLSKRG